MSIYGKNGSELSACCSLNGDALNSAYDLYGNVVFTSTPSKYSIDNVVSYFKSRTLSVCAEINELSEDWDSFVHITDPHGTANKYHSQAIGLYILSNTSAKFLVLGGDYNSWHWGETGYGIYMEPILNSGMMDNIYAVLGNHEVMENDGTASKAAIYNDFLKDKTNIVGSLADNYYYFDDSTKKVRYMFLNTSDVDQYHVSETQKSWIQQNVILPDATWSLWIISHVNLIKMANVTYQNEADGATIAASIASNCNGTVIGALSGHQHCDIIQSDGNFYHATMQGDLFSNTNYYDGISVTDRVAGTISEQAVSVISFNTTTKDVVIRRIGAGRNQTMSYNYGGS